MFQRLFLVLGLKERLRQSFRHLASSKIYRSHVIFMMLVTHLLLGFRELRDVRYYQDDEMVKRTLGLKHLPDVSTISRALADADERSVDHVRAENQALVLDRIDVEQLPRLTLDFDGSVLSTGRHAEGTAVGYNKRKKGQRSYYPLFCTVSQTGQVFDFLHRSGNVHDSNGAEAFISRCFATVRDALPGIRIESRLDSAFFSEDIIQCLEAQRVDFTASVPFERFPELKSKIERCQTWYPLDDDLCYFETPWKPEQWDFHHRFVFVRKRVTLQHKGPIQLDLFTPHQTGYDFKVIVTNRWVDPRKVVMFHEGRGAQEGIFGELKSHCHMGYVPVTTLCGNQLYMLAGILAHNLTRELQMIVRSPLRGITINRAAHWAFEKVHTIRRKLINRAGRILRPQGKLVLSMKSNAQVENELLHCLSTLDEAAREPNFATIE